MATSSVKVNNRYQITVPQKARKRLKIKSGDQLLVDVQDGILIILPEPRNYTKHLARLYREIWKKSDEYINGEREAWNASPAG